MGKLSPEQAKQLKELTDLANAPDDEDFEVEIFDGEKGARVPYSKGRSWLQKTFGIDLGEPPADEEEEDGEEGKPAKPTPVHFRGRGAKAG